jgi:hypothetical protein
MARLLKTPYFKDTDEDYRIMMNNRDAKFDKLWQKHNQAAKEGKIKGRIFSYPVADGAAHYLVKKEKPLTLQWINVGDCWQVPAYVIRGLRADDIY